ncbi:hypothetical protein [Thermomonas sp.]|uniref:hypothetical protein n=1 Tax=Thermomonas sp. TaxID=1971895 RepID=UPI0024897779|nr:hypothetical protein [Thermomonas sp.]MDI1252590.1 hypothetical protein [Thermomonas sp.]
MQRRKIVAIAVSTALTTVLAALPAASQQGKTPPTNLYIDVSTHNMAGMPDIGGMMGGLGGFMARRMGGADASKPTYPTTHGIGGLSGQYLDIALHNALKPGVEAQDQVPAGLNLGNALTLIPIEPTTSAPSQGNSSPGKIPDVEMKISEYWGCGATVRPGQPKITTIKVKGGTLDGKGGMRGMDFKTTGSMSKGLFAPDRDIDLKPGYVYWPNRKDGKQVPSGARLAGDHKMVGDGIPDSMQFQVQQASDFMPKLALRSQGEMSDAVNLSWPTVDRARAYFITGMHMEVTGQNSYNMVIWSSADVAGAGSDLHAFLTGSYIDKWLKQKVLLPSSATSCTIPKGIFAGAPGSQGAMPGMLMMTAYGPESWITYPPKPADVKKPWNPEWSVRLRAKSTATAILGLDLGNMQPGNEGEDGEQQQQPQKRPSMKGLLKGILGG